MELQQLMVGLNEAHVRHGKDLYRHGAYCNSRTLAAVANACNPGKPLPIGTMNFRGINLFLHEWVPDGKFYPRLDADTIVANCIRDMRTEGFLEPGLATSTSR